MNTLIHQVIAEDLMINSADPGIRLHLRYKHLLHAAPANESNVLIMVHGATYASESLFDVPVAGHSLMDQLAFAGLHVFALDIRGYGKSDRPAAMMQDPKLSAPVSDTQTGIGDLASAVDYLLSRYQLQQLNVFGMSWGGSVAAAYSTRYPQHVTKLALVAPQWLNSQPSHIDIDGDIAAWREVNPAAFQQAWLANAPEEKRADLIPEGVFQRWLEAVLASDADYQQQSAGKIRAVNGPSLDKRRFWRAGIPFYDPAEIRAPLLLVHAEWDNDVPFTATADLFKRCSNTPWRRWLEIGEGSHMILLEKNHWQAWDAITCFYTED